MFGCVCRRAENRQGRTYQAMQLVKNLQYAHVACAYVFRNVLQVVSF